MEKKILTPVKIGPVEVKNRVMFPSMCTFFCDSEGFVSDDQLGLVEDLAKGGTGLIVVPGSPHGKPGPGRPALSDDKYIPGWRTMAEIAHRYGAKLFCQLHPAAVQAGRDKVVKKVEDYPKDLIAQLVHSYALEAERCKRAGVDGVEIHGAHAHEIAQFMSPHYNTRTDEYGGDYRGRARYSLEIVRAIKELCGKDYPLIFRISGDEMVEGGRKLPETIQIIKLLEEAGADAVHVSIGMPESEEYMCAPMDIPDCFNADAAAQVKKAVGIPVITVGRIATMEEAEKLLEAGVADLTAIGRAQLADPALVNKYAGLDPEPVCRCVGCNQGCRAATVRKKIRCMQNPRVGQESVLVPMPVPASLKGKKIMIVGAGPAGLEAAVLLAQQGLHPTVFERESIPGGRINLAKLPPFKANMDFLTQYRVEMLKRLGVEIHYNTPVDLDLIAREAPDILFIATGSTPLIPPIPGIDGPGIYTGDQILETPVELGEHIAVLGGGLIGCETAEKFATSGKKVEIFEMRDDVAVELTESRRTFMLRRIHDLGIPIHTDTKILKVALPSITIEHDGVQSTLNGFDNLIVAAGRQPEAGLLQSARDRFPHMRIIPVGDVTGPSLAIEAIHGATDAVISLLKS
jgi:2,4-dienoyl-CoA reductase-like NADH-dependent reductase (Old Yellow Enzyme family)/thioredoxin reductase